MMRDVKSVEDAIESARDLNDSRELEANMEMNAVVAELLLDIRELLRTKDSVSKWGSHL